MNLLERRVDRLGPGISVRLRLAKAQMHGDALCKVLRDFVAPSRTVVDIGAHRGVYTWLMSRLVGSGGHVHAFEPYPANVQRLNALASSRPNIVVHPCALSDSAGEATLRVPRYHNLELDALSTLRSTVSFDPECISVPMHTLDEVAASQIYDEVDLIKCDVEGHEDEVINGAWATITQNMPVLLIEIEQRHRREPVSTLVNRLLDIGYDGFFVGNSGLRAIDEFDIEHHQLSFLTPEFVPYSMPAGYISDFMFVPNR